MDCKWSQREENRKMIGVPPTGQRRRSGMRDRGVMREVLTQQEMGIRWANEA
jgi:hypothetical protein